MNMISLTSNSQLNEIKLDRYSIRMMKSALQTLTAVMLELNGHLRTLQGPLIVRVIVS